MGDRFDRLGVRHANVEALLRRPGIGHNNGPTFDMSWEAWVWRRATAKAWKTPKPEVAKMRLKRAERLGITYKELASVIMDSGAHLGAAVLPLFRTLNPSYVPLGAEPEKPAALRPRISAAMSSPPR